MSRANPEIIIATNPEIISKTMVFSGKFAKFKKFDSAPLILTLALAIFQFVLPLAEKDGIKITSFQALQYGNVHWAFNYFYFILLIVILSLALFFLSKEKNLSLGYDASLWFFTMVGAMIFLGALQGFLEKNPSLGIQENALNGVVSVLISGIGSFITYGKLFNHYEKIAKEKKEKNFDC
jgi:hypothetical protein